MAAGCASLLRASESAPPRPPASDEVSLISQQRDASGKVRLNETVLRRDYVVAGTTLADIRVGLQAEAATGDGGRYDGLTRWAVHWTFRYDRGPQGCFLAGAELDLSIEVRLPRLQDESVLAPDVLAHWRSYLVALETHEMGHAGRETTVIEGLRDAFEAAPPQDDCTLLGQALNALGDDFLTQVSMADEAYDRETDHGRAQGATFD